MKNKKQRKPYLKPKLVRYGQISKLTTSGSGMTPEGTMIKNMSRHP